MAKQYPSIFNDVIGPVMRGPSSSHCAAAARIGLLARALMDGRLTAAEAAFDRRGSLATTYLSQGSEMGLCGGLLGMGPEDDRLADYRRALAEAGLAVRHVVGDFGDPHPNTYRLTLENDTERRTMVALSTGGGMIEVIEIDGHPVSLRGDAHETLVFAAGDGRDTARAAAGVCGEAEVAQVAAPGGGSALVRVRSRQPLADDRLAALSRLPGVSAVRRLPPVLPVLTPPAIELPFATCAQMLAYNRGRGLDLADLALAYESARGGIALAAVDEKMRAVVRILRRGVEAGLAGTRWEDRILGAQSPAYERLRRSGRLIDLGVLDQAVAYVAALMEVKSAMGVIVAAPTAGACGGMPGAVLAAADRMGAGEKQVARALLAGGLVGVFIAAGSTFAAEVAGCQAECGAGSGMAAAALVTLAGGKARTAVDAAAMALQNILGMVCDPVANRVEVPCLGKNVMAAANALSCANMALAGFDAVIPLDEVIAAMDAVGRSLPAELRCTALGGLSVTPTAKRIEERLSAAQPPTGP